MGKISHLRLEGKILVSLGLVLFVLTDPSPVVKTGASQIKAAFKA
jgi:hypothetical protein